MRCECGLVSPDDPQSNSQSGGRSGLLCCYAAGGVQVPRFELLSNKVTGFHTTVTPCTIRILSNWPEKQRIPGHASHVVSSPTQLSRAHAVTLAWGLHGHKRRTLTPICQSRSSSMCRGTITTKRCSPFEHSHRCDHGSFKLACCEPGCMH